MRSVLPRPDLAGGDLQALLTEQRPQRLAAPWPRQDLTHSRAGHGSRAGESRRAGCLAEGPRERRVVGDANRAIAVRVEVGVPTRAARRGTEGPAQSSEVGDAGGAVIVVVEVAGVAEAIQVGVRLVRVRSREAV